MIHSLHRRLTTCAVICLLAVTAKAQIVYFGTPVVMNTAVASGHFQRYTFNFSTGGVIATNDQTAPPNPTATQFRFVVLNNESDRTGVQLEYGDGTSRVVGVGGGNLTKMNFGDAVSAANATANVGSSLYVVGVFDNANEGVFTAGSPGYMGFSFTTGGSTYFGWAQITVSSDTLGLTINQFAYNGTAGAAITAGQTSAIPEPSTYAAIAGALVLVGAMVYRSKRANTLPVV